MNEIHITDLESFTSCRRRWEWSSLMRRGLQRAVIPEPLFLGQGVHVGLDAYHSHDHNIYKSEAVFKQWLLDRIAAIKEYSGGLWEHEREMVNDIYRLGTQMLKHYHLWHSRHKLDQRYEVLATEQRFNVPIPIPGAQGGYKRMRQRGHRLHPELGWVDGDIYLAGRFDGVVRDRTTGQLWLLEFKTSRSLSTVSWVMRGMQGTAYVWAARALGWPVRGILYRILRKKIPDSPRRLQSGWFSQAKSVDTTFEYYKFGLDLFSARNGLPVKQVYTIHKDALTRLYHEADGLNNTFFMQREIKKPQALMDNTMRAVHETGKLMANPRTPIYATPGWNLCNNCPFRDPCDLMELGMEDEADDVLEAEYAPRGYWE